MANENLIITVKLDESAQILAKVIDMLEGAERMGSDLDKPEGSRYIQISETLALELSKELRSLLEVEA